MAANSRLTIAVHALAWMALAQRRGQQLLTSDQVAASVNTNPVIIRRSLGDLRRAGLVEVRHGAGAGWSLARTPEEITLLDVYDAVEQEPLFGMHRSEPNLVCPVGRGIRPALGDVYRGVDQALRHELRRTSIADVLRQTLRESTSEVRYPIVELRQYTLRPGQRDALISLFDREFVESQEAAGMAVIGQFRDLDDPDRFVWLRGFPDMPRRAAALGRFYGGPVWRTHGPEANATMVDSDNVLLLRPVTTRTGFPIPTDTRPPPGHGIPRRSLILVTLYHGDRPFDQSFVDFFDRDIRPVLVETGAPPLACLQSEPAENTFPALPVRVGENVFVWFARFTGPADLDRHLARVERAKRWRDRVQPILSTMLTRPPQRLRLAPTGRSLLH